MATDDLDAPTLLLEEHREAEAFLRDLERLEASDERFEERGAKLIREVRHHLEEEETDLLPKLSEAVPADRPQERAGRFRPCACSQATWCSTSAAAPG